MRSCMLAALLLLVSNPVEGPGAKALAAESDVRLRGQTGVVTVGNQPWARFSVPRVAGELGPENPKVKRLWETKYPFFGPEDYGFTMENYGHGGVTSPEGEGVGTFTIYDWGNGAASEARNRICDHYGDVYVDRARRRAFGIDGIAVEIRGARVHLRDLAGVEREVRIVFDDGSSRTVRLQGETDLPL